MLISRTLDDGSVMTVDTNKAEPNPYYERFTSPTRVSNHALEECRKIATIEHIPAEIVLDRAISIGLNIMKSPIEPETALYGEGGR
jgi:hypothetical protein